MKVKITRIIVITLGWIFITLGIAGLFLPFLQGILFLFIGLYFLSHNSIWAKKLLSRLKKKYPSLNTKFSEIKAKNKNLLKRVFGK